jgi:nicotinate-nucleotide adenylyltransferase
MTEVLRVGIFGGTFDPPHQGHLILAREACRQLQLDRLLWVLTPDPPHKHNQVISPLAMRLLLTSACILGDQRYELSRVDLDRPGPHYAVDSVQLLREQYPHAVLCYLVGGDSLRDLPRWHQPQAFIQAVDELGVMRRPKACPDLDRLEELLPGLSQKVRWVATEPADISSTDIRNRIASGQSYEHLLSPQVVELIEQNHWYR